MSPVYVVLCYGSAIAASLLILWRFGHKSWGIHTLAVMVALTIGAVPLAGFWSTPSGSLAVGWAFLALFVWGVGGPFAALLQHGPAHGQPVRRRP